MWLFLRIDESGILPIWRALPKAVRMRSEPNAPAIATLPAGGFRMQSGEVIFEVAKPPAEVWARLVDVERTPDWVKSMQSSSLPDGGPIGLGSPISQQLEINGALNEAKLKVTVFDPCTAFAHEGESGPATFTARFDLEEISGGTRVVHGFSVTLGGVMRMMEPMVGGWVKKNAQESVQSLKRLIEAGE
jgi:carbon monoxide dehydrogenase subunit G